MGVTKSSYRKEVQSNESHLKKQETLNKQPNLKYLKKLGGKKKERKKERKKNLKVSSSKVIINIRAGKKNEGD